MLEHTEKQKSSRKQKETDRVRVYLVRLWGGGGLWGRRWFRLPVGVLRGGLVALIGRVRGRDHRPGCLDWSWRVGCSHCMRYSWGLLYTVTGCRGMGVGWGRLSTEEQERKGEIKWSEKVNLKSTFRGHLHEQHQRSVYLSLYCGKAWVNLH